MSDYQKQWYQENKLKILEQQREYRKNNRTRILNNRKQYDKQYRLNNKEQIRLYKKDYQKAYDKLRIKKDINYRFKKNLRKRIWAALNGLIKSVKTQELIGCSIDALKQHLELKFQPGMTWGNYGQWHVDHIKPCSSFNLEIVDEQKKCFNYSNLQPLWAIDNIKKGNTI